MTGFLASRASAQPEKDPTGIRTRNPCLVLTAHCESVHSLGEGADPSDYYAALITRSANMSYYYSAISFQLRGCIVIFTGLLSFLPVPVLRIVKCRMIQAVTDPLALTR